MILDIRFGLGFDVHALTEGRKLILGGVEIPHHLGLLGHSDADVLIHAIMDGMLGALALGDIGKHFPDTDDRYKGISSIELLKHVHLLIKKNGYTINNIDSVIIAEKPKLASYIDLMREKLASVLEVPVNRISVKATTTEKLGFNGREEGITAQAIVSLVPISGKG